MIERFFSPYFYYLQNFLMSVKTDYSISVGDIIATLSILFAIYQFRKQMALSRQEHVDSQKETWFLNVIVLPQLPEIKGFYKVLSKNVLKHRTKLRSLHGASPLILGRMGDYKSIELNKVKEFFDNLKPLVKSYDDAMWIRISVIELDLQDICTELVESYEDVTKDTDVASKILNNEQGLILLLNKGLKR